MDSDRHPLILSSEKSTWKARSGFTLTPSMWFRQLLWRDILLILLGFTNILTFGFSFQASTTLNDCIKMTWSYSPLHDRFRVTMAEHKAIHATLGLGPNASEFRGNPSPEVDAAWDRVTQTYLYPITKEDVLKMGNDPAYAVLMPEEMGFGGGHYAGFMDVEHKIHCLDVLRKDIYSDYYGKNDSPLWRTHVDHCMYILLEGLMCQPNLQVIPYVWTEGHPAPVPDFIQNEKCWDFDTVVTWRRSHGHLNDRNYYGLYQKLRHKSKEKPVTPDMKELRQQEAIWKLGSPSQSEHHHF